MLIAIPSAFGLAVLAEPIMEVLFNDTTEMTTRLMQLGAAAIIFYAYSTTSSNILQGLNLLKYPVIHAISAIAIYVVIDYIFLAFFDMEVYALIVGHTLFPLIIQGKYDKIKKIEEVKNMELKNNERIESINELQNKDFYLALYNQNKIDKQQIYNLTKKINDRR